MDSELKNQIEKFKSFTIIVEGKKDAESLRYLGFKKILVLHSNKTSIANSIEKISSQISKTEKVCILTDLDKKGRYFHAQLKSSFQEKGIKCDLTLRKLIAKSGVSHIEGLNKFVENN